MKKRKGALLLEMVLSLAILAILLTVTFAGFFASPFRQRTANRAYMNSLKSALLDQRMRSVREPGHVYRFRIDSKGTVSFYRAATLYMELKGEGYQTFVKGRRGASYEINTLWDFKNRAQEGNNGFTLNIYKDQRLIGQLIYQVGSSTFREVLLE